MNSKNVIWMLLIATTLVISGYFLLGRDNADNVNETIIHNVDQSQATIPPSAEPKPEVSRSEAEVKENLQFIDFQKRAQQLFDHADSLDEQKKQAELKAIQDAAQHFEEQGKLVAMEALLLKLAMLKYTTNGEQEYKDKAQALIERYKAISDAKEQAWLNNPDPRFVDYKRREQDIVKEVMAMTVIPDGLSKDEYLRQQLEQARITAMGDGGG